MKYRKRKIKRLFMYLMKHINSGKIHLPDYK